MNWISVEKRLPEVPCLVYWSDDKYTVLVQGDSVGYVVKNDTEFRVTHWQPLPKPPEIK